LKGSYDKVLKQSYTDNTIMRDYKTEIAGELTKITSIEADKIYSLIEIPPQKAMGDYAFPCFSLAKEMRK
jgi:arginyl-tRNA synthetase